MSQVTCTIPHCGNRIVARGWCSRHYMRWKRYGAPDFRLAGEILDGKKVCPWCKDDIPLSEYSPGASYCRSCVATRKRNKPRPAIIRNTSVFCVECGCRFTPTRNTDICCSDDCYEGRKRRHMREHTLRYRALRAGAFVESVDAAAVLERDNWICQLCLEPIDRDATYPHRRSQSIDHIQPLHTGGLHEYANCQAAHLSCNASKGARTA